MTDARPLVFALVERPSDLALVTRGAPLGALVAINVAQGADASAGDALLARAQALGAARVARVADAVLSGVDYLAVAHVLACAIRHLCEEHPQAPVVVLAGDRGRGAVGPAVAERLAVPHLGGVQRVTYADGQLAVERLTGDELRRYTGAPPAVLVCAVDEAPAEPAAAAPGGAVVALSLETLQITPLELQYRRRFRPAPGSGPRARPYLVSNVEVLGERLARDGLWPLPRERAKPDAAAEPAAGERGG